MGLDSTHPLYSERLPDWTEMRDTYKGERAVKAKGTTYLPATQGMIIDGMGGEKLGQKAYDAYRTRAVFPDYVQDAVEAFIGLLHQKPPTIELPKVMEPLREKCTTHGESLELLLRRINEEQLVTGRCGLLLDLPTNPDPANPMPYVALYISEAIKNWDDAAIEEGESRLNLVVLDESGFKRTEFQWDKFTKYRVLMLGELEANEEGNSGAKYIVGVYTNAGGGAPTFVQADMKAPMLRGNTLEEIPFVFINSKDIVPEPDAPPLMALARQCLTIYRGEADYRQNLFMQGQDTFVIIGDRKKAITEDVGQDAGVRTGAGSLVELEAVPGADAKYVGVTSTGLTEQRSALENDRKRAETKSGQLIDATNGSAESGAALNTRIGAQTATLNQLAQTGAAALEKMLKFAASWMGANPDEVKVTPNMEFADFEMTGENLVKLMTARSMGAPLSKESIHALMVDQGLTKLDFETEQDKIDEENANDPLLKGLGTDAGGNPDDPNDPANKEPGNETDPAKDPKKTPPGDPKKPAFGGN